MARGKPRKFITAQGWKEHIEGMYDDIEMDVSSFVSHLLPCRFIDGKYGEFFRKPNTLYAGVIAGHPEAIKDRRKATNLRIYGAENTFASVQIKEKIKKGNMEKYGVEYSLQRKDIREDIKRTNNERYGADTPMASQKVRDKMKNTCMEKYGVDNAAKNNAVKDKMKKTNNERYGGDGPFSSQEIRDKSKATCMERYGVEYITQSDKHKQDVHNALVKSGLYHTFDGKSADLLSEQYGKSRSGVRKLLRNSDLSDDQKRNILEAHTSSKQSTIEFILGGVLSSAGVEYVCTKQLGSFVPDFRVDSHSLVVEADGEYWHTEKYKNNKIGSTGESYHRDRFKNAEENGYKLIAFHGQEINELLPIVESIVNERLGVSLNTIHVDDSLVKPVMAEDAIQFFQSNHLEGEGSGRAFGLYHRDRLVACIQVANNKDGLSVSRYAHVINTQIDGSFDKLLKHIEIVMKPTFVQVGLNIRYDTSSYLKGLDFTKESEHTSFCWYYKKERHHKSKFTDIVGHEIGASKIWDSGNEIWIKHYRIVT